MSPTRRRAVLALLGSSLGLAAGCAGSSDDPSQTATATSGATTERTTTTQRTTSETVTQTETSTPTVNRRLSTAGTWTQFQFAASKTGANTEATAVPDDGSVYWKRPKGGMPILDGRRVYAVERHRDRSLLVQRALETGEKERTFETGGGSQTNWVAASDDAVFAPTESGVISVDPATWTENWTAELLDAPAYGPTVSEGTVYVSAGSFVDDAGVVAAIDQATGERKWEHEVRNASPVAADGDRVFYAVGSDLLAVDAESGETKWRRSSDSTVKAHPILAGNRVFSVDQHAVRCSNRTDGTVVWTHSVEGGTANGLAADGRGHIVYADDEGVGALDAATGTRQWRSDVGLAVTPSAGAEAIYVGTVRGPSQFVALDPESGDERWSRSFPDVTVEGDVVTSGAEGPPAVFDGGILVRAADGLYAFGN